jgi:hypothetical protein
LAVAASRRRARAAFLELTIHELAHAVERDCFRAGHLAPQIVQAAAEQLIQRLAAEPIDPGRPPFADHGPGYIRTVLHLQARAARLGVATSDAGVFDAELYQVSPLRRYRVALGDEPERFALARLSVVAELPAPEAFDRLWANDMRRWSETQTPAAVAA